RTVALALESGKHKKTQYCRFHGAGVSFLDRNSGIWHHSRSAMRINWVHPIIGVLICGSAAALTAIRYFGHPAPENLPLVFLIVVLCVSLRFGVSAGIVGYRFRADLRRVHL